MDIIAVQNIFNQPVLAFVFILLTVWSLVWKGIALWVSARHRQRNWFIAMLLLSTLGILEMVYLFYFQKDHA